LLISTVRLKSTAHGCYAVEIFSTALQPLQPHFNRARKFLTMFVPFLPVCQAFSLKTPNLLHAFKENFLDMRCQLFGRLFIALENRHGLLSRGKRQVALSDRLRFFFYGATNFAFSK